VITFIACLVALPLGLGQLGDVPPDLDDPARVREFYRVIQQLVSERRLLAFFSKGHDRIAEPHDYGVKDKVRKLLYYQVGGGSNSHPPTGWRWADADEMTGARLLEERFAGARPAPTGQHVKWDKLFASVSEKG